MLDMIRGVHTGWVSLLLIAGCSQDQRQSAEAQTQPLRECVTAVWVDKPLACHCPGTDIDGAEVCESSACRQFNVLVLGDAGQSYEFLAQDASDLRALRLPPVILSKGPWRLEGDSLIQELPTRTLIDRLKCDQEHLNRSSTQFTRMDSARRVALEGVVEGSTVPTTVRY